MLKRSLKRHKNGSKVEHKVPIGETSISPKALGDKTDDDESERVLEKVVLGGEDDVLEQLEKSSRKKRRTQPVVSEDGSIEVVGVEPKPAWEDDDEDDRIKISERDYRHRYFKHRDKKDISADTYKEILKSQYEKVTGQPSWAKLSWQKPDDEEDDESDDDTETKQMIQSTGNYLTTTPGLDKGLLQIKQCADANREQPAECKLLAMEFHPTAQVMLTGGSKQTLALFQVDGKHNPKIQSIFLEKYPILCAHFTTDGTEVVIASRHGNFKYYDMIAGQVVTVPRIKGIDGQHIQQFSTSPDGKYLVFIGQYGCMHMISAKSKEWISTLKMNGEVGALSFTADGTKMLSHGDEGEVYVWDMMTRSCVHRFHDDGCIKGSSLAVANNGRYIAAGSESGVVNLYDESCLSENYPKPLRAIMNLTTPCTSLVFNSTSEILAMASKQADNAVRLLHVSSQSVFSNFPSMSDHTHQPHTVDFSLNSGYFAIGNNKGKALLYRLKHYGNY